jgi:carbamoyltransferase
VYILGLNAAYHESAACLIKDGQVRAAIEEERLNRRQHGKLSTPDTASLLPWRAIKVCLEYEGIGLEDIAHVGYSFDPHALQAGVDAWRRHHAHEHDWPLEDTSYQTREGGMTFVEGVWSAKKQLAEKPGFRADFHFLSHHACHAASAFHVSPFDKAAVLVIDGIGEWASTTLYRGEGTRLQKIRELTFPNSLGFVWEKISRYLGFSRYDASKVMGLAAYGDASQTIEAFSRLMPDPTALRVDPDLLRHESPDFSRIEQLFGLPRRSTPVDFGVEDWQAYVDVAAGLQHLTEQALLHLLGHFDPGEFRHLCMAGGVALNCAANGAIVRSRRFDDVFVQPAAHDAGTALGAAFLIWHEILGQERSYVFRNAYLGPEYSDEDVARVLGHTCLRYEKVDIVREVARLLAEGQIVGWFQGRMEWGPRALGNRSLLADPRSNDIREAMNVKVKHRERYRPFCPSVLADKAGEWFDAGADVEANKYMLTTSTVRPGRRDLVPAVIHEDGTVRAQAVSRADNPRYYELITEFAAMSGVPLLLNTSFNDSEPIVCSPHDAIKTFMKTDIDHLALGSYLVSKPDRPIDRHTREMKVVSGS